MELVKQVDDYDKNALLHRLDSNQRFTRDRRGRPISLPGNKFQVTILEHTYSYFFAKP